MDIVFRKKNLNCTQLQKACNLGDHALSGGFETSLINVLESTKPATLIVAGGLNGIAGNVQSDAPV